MKSRSIRGWGMITTVSLLVSLFFFGGVAWGQSGRGVVYGQSVERDESLAVDDAGTAQSEIVALKLPVNGFYQSIAGGAGSGEMGHYQRGLTGKSSAALAVTPTRTRTPTRTPTQTRIAEAMCTALVQGLNVRSGPGTEYAPPIGNVPNGAQLRMLGRNAQSTWVEIQVVETGLRGWVSGASQYVSCTRAIRSLPLGNLPPTPTPTRMLIPTPTPRAVAIAAPGGGGPGRIEGTIYTNPSFVVGYNSNNAPIFRTFLYLQLQVWDRNGLRKDGEGIGPVTFTFFKPDGSDFSQTEQTPAFCSFGGGEPNCNVLDLRNSPDWPDGEYSVNIIAEADNGDSKNWNLSIEIDRDQTTVPARGVVVQIAETAPGTTDSFIFDELSFRVTAFDSSRGNIDGTGISHVNMRIVSPSGRVVQERRENNAGYCVFSGGEPDCNIFNFADNNFTWPNGDFIESGEYRLEATAFTANGQQGSLVVRVQIE